MIVLGYKSNVRIRSGVPRLSRHQSCASCGRSITLSPESAEAFECACEQEQAPLEVVVMMCQPCRNQVVELDSEYLRQ